MLVVCNYRIKNISVAGSVFHEVIESYFGGKDIPGDSTSGYNIAGFTSAHVKASALDPRHIDLNRGFIGPNHKTVTFQNPNTLVTVDLYNIP